MLIHPTLDQLKALKLDGMAEAFVELQSQSQAAELGHAEWLALLLDREFANRNTRRFHVRLRLARLPRPGRHRGCRLPNAAAARQGAVRATRGQQMD
jgi:DNA replication protein DnaC